MLVMSLPAIGFILDNKRNVAPDPLMVALHRGYTIMRISLENLSFRYGSFPFTGSLKSSPLSATVIILVPPPLNRFSLSPWNLLV